VKYLISASPWSAQKQSPSSIASIAFDKAVFGKHPYAHETIGTQDTIKNITTEESA
jgi:zinc protease